MAKNNILQGENYIGIDYKYTINKTTSNKTFSLKSYLITSGFISELNTHYSNKIIEKIVVKYGVTSGYKGTWKTHILITINGKNYTSAVSAGYVVNSGYKTLTQTIYNKDGNGNIQSDYGITIGEALNDASPFNPRIVIDQKGYGTLYWDNTTGARHAEFIIYYKEPSSGDDPGEEPLGPSEDPTPENDIIKDDNLTIDYRVMRYDRSSITNEYFISNMGNYLRFPVGIIYNDNINPWKQSEYFIGDKVRYNQKVWSSTVDNNTSIPGENGSFWSEENEISYFITDVNINFYQVNANAMVQYISECHFNNSLEILPDSNVTINLPTSNTKLKLLDDGIVSNTVVILPDGTEIPIEEENATLNGTVANGYYAFVNDDLGVPNYYQIEIYGYTLSDSSSKLLCNTELLGIDQAQPQFSIEPGGIGIGVLAESSPEAMGFTIAKNYPTTFQGDVKINGDLIAKSVFYLPSDLLYIFDSENKIFIEDSMHRENNVQRFDDYMVLTGNGRMTVSGFVSSSSSRVFLNIITNKSMKYVDEVFVKELSLSLRKVSGGYIIGENGAVSVISDSNYTVETEIASDYMLTIKITKTTSYDTANNVPIAGLIYNLALGFTCFGE